MMEYSLAGLWSVELSDGTLGEMYLPGTLDENRIGHRDVGNGRVHPDEEPAGLEEGSTPNSVIATRFTRNYTFEGIAYLRRKISFDAPAGKRIFLEAERARVLALKVNGQEIPDFIEPSISTPHIFEVTGLLGARREQKPCGQEEKIQEDELTLISDNSYQGLPHDAIVYSSAATDETQTNWNGILGDIRLRIEESVFLQMVRVYPKGENLDVEVEVCSDRECSAVVGLFSEALDWEAVQNQAPQTVQAPDSGKMFARETCEGEKNCGESVSAEGYVERRVFLRKGWNSVSFVRLPLRSDVRRWDEYEGFLYEMRARLQVYDGDQQEKTVTFGIRDFGDDGKGKLALNGRTIFLRSEANCAEFPETGHPPMTVEEWTDVLIRLRSYGVNCVRFHSHCPPEAAFTAADRLGLLMQPELSHWNPKDAFESEESFAYYQKEMRRVILQLANHPSFVMLTFGNELQAGELGHERMRQMLRMARKLDDTRLYAEGSNVHYGERECEQESNFYATQSYLGAELRGTFANHDPHNRKIKGYINNQYPDACTDYRKTMEKIRKTYRKPVFSFEVGQFEVLPDFDELEEFRGVSRPDNYRLIQEKAKQLGLSDVWKRYVEATGELALIGYREEIEAALRTEQLSGISLLGLQDFPGQGTALVGMLNSHLQPKPFSFARPERFRAFFRDQLPLVMLPRYTYEYGEVLRAEVKLANYGKRFLAGKLHYALREWRDELGEPGEEVMSAPGGAREKEGSTGILAEGTLPWIMCPQGQLTEAGVLELPLDRKTLSGMEGERRNVIDAGRARHLKLTVSLDGVENSYPVWVYPPVRPVCPASVYEARFLDEQAGAVLEAGGKVYLSPDSDAQSLPHSIQAQFTTDFWSVGTFPMQEGGMGQLIQEKHPIFREFPTSFHTDWQWWAPASQRAIILPQNQAGLLKTASIITEMDSYAYMRPMTQLLECRVGKGKLLLSSLGLQNLQQYPETRALQAAIYRYMDSEEFAPQQEVELEVLKSLVK